MYTKRYKFQQGLSLIEVMIVVAITGILLSIGGPGIVHSLQKTHIKGVSEETYFMFKQARSQAVAASSDITLEFTEGAQWCIGMSDTGPCDCSVVNSCQVNNVDTVMSYQDFGDISISSVSFGGDDSAVFDSQRGLALADAGMVEFTDSVNSMRVSLTVLGRSKMCVSGGQIGDYPSC